MEVGRRRTGTRYTIKKHQEPCHDPLTSSKESILQKGRLAKNKTRKRGGVKEIEQEEVEDD